MTEMPTADDVVARHWPLHGPYSPARAESAAAVLADMVRYLNYATGQGAAHSLPYAADVYALLGPLVAAVGGLDQTLRQLRQRTTALGTDHTLRHSQHPDDHHAAASNATAAGQRLAAAQQAAATLRTALDAARSQLTWLAHDREDW
jgi:hypothetical protein